jgi:hypothetical protein
MTIDVLKLAPFNCWPETTDTPRVLKLVAVENASEQLDVKTTKSPSSCEPSTDWLKNVIAVALPAIPTSGEYVG